MTAYLLPRARQFYQRADGTPAEGWMLYTYAAGTVDTPLQTWQDEQQTASNTNPIIMDARGECSVYFSGSYKLVLTDQNGATIWTQDYVEPVPAAFYSAGIFSALLASSGAGMVGFSQSITYPAKTIGAKLNLVVSVKDDPYNAVGDGNADDTAAIQAAMVASPYVFIPPGIYKLSGPLVTAFAGQKVYGAGSFGYGTGSTVSGTMLHQTNLTSDIFTVTNNNFNASDFSVYCDANPTGGCVVNSGSSGTVLERIWVNSCFQGFYFHDNTDHKVDKCTIQGCYDFAIGVNNTNDITVSNVVATSHSASTSTNGLLSLAGYVQAVIMTNVDFISGTYGMVLNPSGPITDQSKCISFCKFTNVYFDSSVNGASISGCNGMTFTNCWFSNRPGSGAEIGDGPGCDGVSFIGCIFAGCGSSGAVLHPGANRTLFDGCYFVSNSGAVANGSHGLTVVANTSNFIVSNCFAYNGMGFASIQGYGIFVQGGTSGGYNISNCFLNGNGTGSLNDGGTGGGKNVTGNIGYNNPAGVTGVTLTGSPFTLANTRGAPQLVKVTGGAVSDITLFGSTLYGSTGQAFVLPAGQSAVITYSSAPAVSQADIL